MPDRTIYEGQAFLKQVKDLVKSGAALDGPREDCKCFSLVAYAVMKRYNDALRVLLDSHAAVNVFETDANDEFRTPLRYAVEYNPDAVPMLLSAGADPNLICSGGQTVLMGAAQWAPRTVPLLLKAGADVSATDRYGQTALMCAAIGEDADAGDDYVPEAERGKAICGLIAAGADIDAETDDMLDNMTAAMFCAEYHPALMGIFDLDPDAPGYIREIEKLGEKFSARIEEGRAEAPEL